MRFVGKAAFAVDGERVDWHRHFYYKGSMFSNVPNLSVVFGYLNASWTLKADIIAEYSCRVLNHMRATGSDIAVPLLSDTQAKAAETVFDFSSGYVQRALSYLPQNGTAEQWRLNQDYLHDRELVRVDKQPSGRWFAELSRFGVDVAEYTVPCEPGIARPAKYW